MLRALHVVSDLPPGSYAEPATYVGLLAPVLGDRVDLHVFTGARGGLAELELDRQQFPNHVVSRFQHTAPSVLALEATYARRHVVEAFEYVARTFKPDVVHVHSLWHLGGDVIRSAKEAGIPVVMSLHDFWPLCARIGRLSREDEVCRTIDPWRCHRCLFGENLKRPYHKDSIRRRFRASYKHHLWGVDGPYPMRVLQAWWKARRHVKPLKKKLTGNGGPTRVERRLVALQEALSLVDTFLAPSSFMAEEFIKAGVRRDTVRILPSGTVCRPRPNETRSSRRLRFGYLGNITYGEGIDLLLSAFATLPPGLAELHLYGTDDSYAGTKGIFEALSHRWRDLPKVGEGFLRARPSRSTLDTMLVMLARDSGVHLHGEFPLPHLQSRLDTLDCVVVPTRSLGAPPMALREAAASGISVIGADLGGVGSFLREHGYGVLFKAGDLQSLAGEMRRMLEAPGARPTPLDLPDMDRHVGEIVEIYEKLSTGRPARAANRPDAPQARNRSLPNRASPMVMAEKP